MAILSNLATRSLVSARCAIDFKALSRNPEEAIEIAHRMELASQLPKWILTVQPLITREFLMGLMPWSLQQAMTGGPSKQEPMPMLHKMVLTKGLSHWTSQPEEKKLYGEITLPMPVATKEARLASTQRFKSATVC